jgi:hypothetical protein
LANILLNLNVLAYANVSTKPTVEAIKYAPLALSSAILYMIGKVISKTICFLFLQDYDRPISVLQV